MVPVVLFHAGVPGFSGGFLGVDIFFVISGFLITGILLGDMRKGRYSIATFYHRRVRRIAPALLFLLAATTVMAYALLSPLKYRDYAGSLLATVLFCCNFLFFFRTGYFAPSSAEEPLLHTWSLAVEEQFYIVWPLTLLLFYRFHLLRWLPAFLAAVIAGSFLLALLMPVGGHAAAFYLPFSRAWELGLGAMLAVRPVAIGRPWLSETGAALGLAAVVAAIILCSERTPLALASGTACAGTALLIACNSGRTWVGRWLSAPILVGIGLISYSLYLWHWPLLAFAHYHYVGLPPAWVRGALVVAAVAVAYLSWRFVERPFRRPDRGRPVLVMAGSAATALLAAGLIIVAANGFPGRFASEVAATEATLKPPQPCDGCRFGAPGPPVIVLWGDSHAMAMADAVRRIAAETGLPGLELTRSACLPLLGTELLMEAVGPLPGCLSHNARALETITRLDDARVIILAARWTIGSETSRFGNEQVDRFFLRDPLSREPTIEDSRRVLRAGLARTVAALRRVKPEARIVLLGQVPELSLDSPQCILRARMFGRPVDSCLSADRRALSRLAFGDQLLRGLSTEVSAVRSLLATDLLCRSGQCPILAGDTLLYRDNNHLSAAGAMIVYGQRLREEFAGAAPLAALAGGRR